MVQAWDKTTFIQEVGRLRINIEDAHEITLYIRCASKKSFQNLINGNINGKGYKDKLRMVDVFYGDIEMFKKTYNNDLVSVPEDLFYLNTNNNWTLNKLGLTRLELDNAFAERMIEAFKKDKEFAFILEQLSWLELEDTFNEANLIDAELNIEVMKDLEQFLYNPSKSLLNIDCPLALLALPPSILLSINLKFSSLSIIPVIVSKNNSLGYKSSFS